MITSKQCRDCGETKPASAFYANRQNRDGLGSYCKPCAKVRSYANQARDPEATKETKRRRWAQFALANPEAVKLRELMQRSVSKSLPEPSLTVEDLRALRDDACPCCGHGYTPENRASIDRLEPAKGYMRGNVAYICERCNLLKGTRTALELAAAADRSQTTGKGKGTFENYLALAMYTKHHARNVSTDD